MAAQSANGQSPDKSFSSGMYDRLGEALRDALEKGSIPQASPEQDTEQSVYDAPPSANAEGVLGYDKRMHRFKAARAKRAVWLLHGGKRLPQGTVLHKNAEKTSLNDGAYNGAQPYTTEDFDKDAKDGGGNASGIKAFTPESLDALPQKVLAAYTALGLKAGADEKEIKAAWREKIKTFHPDSNSKNDTVQKVAKQKTLEVMAAYEVLLSFFGK